MAESLPPLDAFDEQHGCRIEASEEATACEVGIRRSCGSGKLLRQLRARAVPRPDARRQWCAGHSAAFNPRTGALHGPPIFSFAFKCGRALCVALRATLDDPFARGRGLPSASAANATESHDIAIRWMGLEAMERLLELNNTAALGWAATAGRPTWDEYGSPGGTLDRGHALREMGSRLEHWQPGTRWMATHGVGAFAPKDSLQVLDGLVKALQGDMGFPGIGLHASEGDGKRLQRW